jgi:AcrR family transcriptional regulator
MQRAVNDMADNVKRSHAVGRPRTVTDEAILDATLEVIGREGPAQLTLALVGEAVGLSPSTLVQRFGSKHGLLLAASRHGVGMVEGAFLDASAIAASPLAALTQALTDLPGDIDSPERLANHLAFLQLDLADPEFRALAVEHARIMRTQIKRLLDEAMASGELRPCDTADLTEAVYAVVSGALITWALGGEGEPAGWLRARLGFLLDCFCAS